MTTILLAETDPELKRTVREVERMCHFAGMGLIVHYRGEGMGILDSVESPIVAFTPGGRLTLDEAVEKYGNDVLLVVGGFTEERELGGDILEKADATVSLGEGFLPIPAVIEGIIEAYEKKAEGRGEENRQGARR